MTDLAAATRAAGFLLPDYGGQCLDGVLPAAAGALGVSLPGAAAARDRLGVPEGPRVCVVLVDGLGQQMLEARAGHAPFLRRLLGGGRVLTAGFPSTTAASMGLLGTGKGPGRTALAGYTVRNPETGALANLVSWEGLGEPRAWQREPPLLEVIAAHTAVSSVGPARFAGSGLTAAALAGGRYVGAESLEARVDATVSLLSRPGLVYLYWGEIDKTGHHHGWQSPEWADALTATDRELSRLARALPPGTVLLVTADHGMVDVERSLLVDVATTPELAAGVALVAGEPRATHVHLDAAASGRDAVQAAADRWQAHLADAAVVATRESAVAAGWFGDVAEPVLPVLGDLVVAATGCAGVVDSRTQTPHSLLLRGMHGSLTPGEMLVPLLVAD